MMSIRKSNDRGHADHGWLKAKHSFSFANYYDPNHTGFGPLLVINEDRVAPGQGFGTHGHRDMEILTYVLDGELAHKDSMGNGSVLRYGDIQRMSAGNGVRHSEFNHSETNPVHLLQIWIQPNVVGIEPGYEEAHFDAASKQNQLRLIASPDGRDGSVKIHQDARVYASIVNAGQAVKHETGDERLMYLHVVRGSLRANDQELSGGDALKLSHEKHVTIVGTDDAEFLLFDLPTQGN